MRSSSGAGHGKAETTDLAPSLEIRLLGPLEVRVADTLVSVSGSKRDALLTVLALGHGRVMSVEELIDALWEENLPAAPRNALQHHVARLRAALGRESIIAYSDGYALKDASVDALRFADLLEDARLALREHKARAGAESVTQALGLWRGPALQGLTDTAWLRAEAQRLEALYVDALEEQFDAALELGEHREIVSRLEAALKQTPFRERLWGQLMLALYRSGRQADALEIFQKARRTLAQDLGLEPGPELRALQNAILAQDSALAAVPAQVRRRGSLPASSTSFIDREAELAQVVELLEQNRLVTLAGPPGVGKTRLAIEAARSLEGGLDGGAWLVELSRAGDGGDVAGLVAQALEARGRDPLAQVIARLQDAGALVIFDACEHALKDAARIISALLSSCPRVRVLATSREVLHLPGEARAALGPLPLPDPGSVEGADSPAVQLLVARARAARPGFELRSESAPLAIEIAKRTDGLPLAIELAAARLGVLGLAELLSVLEQRLALGQVRRSSDPIRTALQELVEWSYELLHADEKTLLHQIAVHRGGASRRSLLALNADQGLDEMTVSYLLGALVDKSIVFVSFPQEEARYELLDTVREYVLDRLGEGGGLAAVRKAHADYFTALAEAAQRGVRGSEWRAWVKRLELDHDNLWVALAYARGAPDRDLAVRLGACLGFYFSLAERVSEGRRFLELALGAVAEDAPVRLRVDLLTYLCFLATEELDLDAALQAGERALALATTAPKLTTAAHARAFLSIALVQSGDAGRAARLAEEARQEAEAAGDHWGAAVASIAGAERAAVAGDVPCVDALAASAARHSEEIDYLVGLIPATFLQAWAAERRGENEVAVAVYRRAIDLADQAGFTDHVGFALAQLAGIALARRDLPQAEELCRHALAAADAADSPWTAAYSRVQLGRVLAATGDTETAARLYRNALESSKRPRPHRARESLQLMLAGDPATAALQALAELADAHGDAAAAAELRARAGLATA